MAVAQPFTRKTGLLAGRFFCGSCKIRAKQKGLLKELGYEGLFDNADELWELMSAEHLASYIAVVKAQDELNAQAVQTTALADKRDTFQKKPLLCTEDRSGILGSLPIRMPARRWMKLPN